MKLIFKLILLILIIYLSYWLAVIITNYFNDYIPKNEIKLLQGSSIIDNDTLTLLTWNIGYAGLAENMDFFYEGGKNVRPNKNYYEYTLMNIKHLLNKYNETYDFILLQEVDFNSKRSYYINQKKYFSNNFKQQIFADSLINYRVQLVPLPMFKPMGKVESGIVSFSKYKPFVKANTYFEQTYSFPKNLFFLDRGILIHGYLYKNGKKIFVVNIHLSAYQDATEARNKELQNLKKLLDILSRNGHYVIVGGDWNINPPNFALYDTTMFNPVYYTEKKDIISSTFNYAYDTNIATNRMVNEPFVSNKTLVSTLDYFLCSKNVDILLVKAIPLYFSFSDHNPVKLKVRLN